MSNSIKLPTSSNTIEEYTLTGTPVAIEPRSPFSSRTVFAAAHVVIDPVATVHPSDAPVIDWPTTMAFRKHLLGLGMGIAEAMDTAQRGMGLSWDNAFELAKRTYEEFGSEHASLIYTGCGTDHLTTGQAKSLDDIVDAYLLQLEKLQGVGARLIIMASTELVRVAKSKDDYAYVYEKVLNACDRPAILHWLGEMFLPALAGYWGDDDIDTAMDNCIKIINTNVDKVEGIKVSLLDEAKEIKMRRLLPEKVHMYSGDDFNYPELIAGDDQGYSDALLGIFDPIAPVASAALAKLDNGDVEGFRKLIDPTVELSRLMFCAPTYYYKTGVVFLAWLNNHQQHFCMLGGAQSMRSAQHFAQLFRFADTCGLLADPELAIKRMQQLLALHGVS